MVETAQADPLLGSMLGKNYRVLELIGVGGMAVVYLVEHQTLLKRFAAKVLRPEHASSAEARARFTQEAHAASQLDHENIVSISDFGVTSDHRPFFVMEHLRGQTLADRLDEGPMSLEEVVAVCVPAARALAHAHAEGIVHRDVKPENIMLVQRSQGRWSVKVLDFGIAKVEENDRMTKTGQAIGSPMYMSPEACRGDDVDMRADVYSFGVVLYLMFAGRVPFSDENILKVLQMQVSSPVPPPTTFAPDLPPAIEAVIMKALEKNVDDRYANMEELLAALESAVPEGADVVLLQAQFGAAATPFPGSLERVRAANASGNFRAQVTGQHNIHVTGQHNVHVTGQHTPQPTHPPAPPRRGRGLVYTLGALVVLAAAGGGGYVYWTGLESSKADAVASKPVAPTEPPAVATNVAAMQPPTTVEPPVEPPVESAAIEPPPEETPDVEDHASEPATVETQTTKNQNPKRHVPPRNVRTAAATTKVVKETKAPSTTPTTTAAITTPSTNTTAPATTGKAGSASPQTTSTSVKAGSAAQPTTTSPTASVKAGSAAPPTASVKAGSAASPTTTTTAISAVPPDASLTPKEPPTQAPTPKAPPKVAVGSLDATPAIATLGLEGSLPSSVVRRSIERVLPSLQACYRTAAKASHSTPPVSLKVRFVIDETGAARRISTSGNFGSLAGCVQESMARVRSQQAPDVGTVSVTVGIKFTPT
ncbi:MAG: protein kinase [Kofleriaceae bacterium]